MRALRPSWVAASAVTVLASAAVAAGVLQPSGAVTSAPGVVAGAPGQVTTLHDVAPAPVRLTFPAPVESSAARVESAPAPAAAAPRPRRTRPAPADPLCTGPGWQARRGAAALASLRRPSDAAGVRVAFHPARPDVLGLTNLGRGSVEVFVRSCGRETDALLRHVLAHELGHALDGRRMTDALRTEWKAARGIPAGTPWFGCSSCTDFATPAGDFAETYAQWQRGAGNSRSELAPAASRAELQDLAARFFRQ